MAGNVLALQGGVFSGKEPAFDGQPMQQGVHLRWTFLAALGFPPWGFWLSRRLAKEGEDRIPAPPLPPPPPRPPLAEAWGVANEDGWQLWSAPFTLPVTVAQWPARYFGAPNPSATQAAADDVLEAQRRLNRLTRPPRMTAAALADLRRELVRLVKGFPSVLLADVQLAASPAGLNAPNLNINLMQQLLLLAIDPYFARVLGLYFVDSESQPGKFDYGIRGIWNTTPCADSVVFPGLAPAALLARRSAQYLGITVSAPNDTSLWRWTKQTLSSNSAIDPSAPDVVKAAAGTLMARLPPSAQPSALLIAAFVRPSLLRGLPQISIALTQPAAAIDAQLSGDGTIAVLSAGNRLAEAPFNSQGLTLVPLAGGGRLIDQIVITGATAASLPVLGALTLHPLFPDQIGNPFAIIPPPRTLQPLPPPPQPYTTFRHRQADIDLATVTLVRSSLFDVEWGTYRSQVPSGNATLGAAVLPPPTAAVGFVLQRRDSDAQQPTAIPGWIATRSATKRKGSEVQANTLYRYVDSQLPDPVTGWEHRVTAFDLFGALGAPSPWSKARGVETIAAAPTAMRIRQFDNSQKGGGAPTADGSAWTGGTLDLTINWAGAAFMMYPGIVSARIAVQAIDTAGELIVGAPLATHDVDVPQPKVQQLTVASITLAPAPNGTGYLVDIATANPALTALTSTDPGQMLMLTLPDGSSERYAVRPAAAAAGAVTATVTAGPSARIVTSQADYIGQPAYLVPGVTVSAKFQVPLPVPIAQTTARAQVWVTGSTTRPFSAETIVDPNGVNPPKPEPTASMTFTAPQRLTPAAPPPVPVPVVPAHQVKHLYYNPADASGQASVELPFQTPDPDGVLGYVLQRASVRSLALADVQRRLALKNPPILEDEQPTVNEQGQPLPSGGNGPTRPDLAAWIASLAQWLDCYNAVAARKAASPANYKPLTDADALKNTAAQLAFIDHFYGGLLDDELRALADLPDNSQGYVRVNPQQLPLTRAVSDSVDGTGYGRTLYRLASVNAAGSFSAYTGSIGPYYTRIVTPPRPPVLCKVQPTASGVAVAWALDTNPDVAAYVLYRDTDSASLLDLRYFGADWSHPSAAADLPSFVRHNQTWPAMSFRQANAPNQDERIVGFVPDPRLCARDYQGSEMAEIVLPPGPAPDDIKGIYRLSDYTPGLGAQGQLAFNYWTPPATGRAKIVTTSVTQTRLTGLRIGLGRGVPVVVVATWGGAVRVLGYLPVRRTGFMDGAAGGKPLDPNNVVVGAADLDQAKPFFYAVVAVDIWGNKSAPSAVFSGQMLWTRPRRPFPITLNPAQA